MKKLVSILLALVLVLSMAACNAKPAEQPTDAQTDPVQTTVPADTTVPVETTVPVQNDPVPTPPADVTRPAIEDLGDGAVSFTFIATLPEEDVRTFVIHTDAKTVGEALLSMGLIDGEDSEWGLYVKRVCDVTLDYETDGMWWGLYENNEMAPVGVDSLEVVEGNVVEFRAEKA